MNKLRRIRSTFMKKHHVLTALSFSAAFFFSTAAFAITGTDSVEMTFNAELTSTTCNAQIVDAAGTATDIINYGEVFKSEIAIKTRVVPFKIVYSDCSGVDSVDFTVKPGAGSSCSGSAYAATTNSVAFELWYGEVDRDTELSCQGGYMLVPLSLTKGYGENPINSRIVVANGKQITDVETGSVEAPITFVITYQ
ncbi:fimbrial protein [Salmonella enterica subsp. salamae]|nr:fimbrial protein [Salmonella enterica subsp. salamae]